MSNPVSNKIALVSGTSSGIGLSTAVVLAQAGYTVVATMRNVQKAEQLQARAREAGVSLDLRPMDVQDDASVTRCVQEVLTSYGKIDLLVNNAGAGFLGTMEQTSEENLRRTMEVNFFGVWRVIQAVFPSMRRAKSGRIVTVTSIGGLIGQPFNDAYCAAKFAVECYLEALAPMARKFGIAISLIEPGPVNTEFVNSVQASMPETSEEIQQAYAPMLSAYTGGTRERFATLGQTADQIAQIILEAATTENPHFRNPTSDMVKGLIARKAADPSGDSMVAFFESSLS